jgi:hypothetical protein
MDPAWAGNIMLENTTRAVAFHLNYMWLWNSWEEEARVDWQLPLFLGRKLGLALPEFLATARAVRMERAAALAGIFWKAGQDQHADMMGSLLREPVVGEENIEITHADAERMATWGSMVGVPRELRERIAVAAHLIIPEAGSVPMRPVPLGRPLPLRGTSARPRPSFHPRNSGSCQSVLASSSHDSLSQM